MVGEINFYFTFHYLKNVPPKLFRPHNVYGPDMGWEHVIPDLMKKSDNFSRE